MGNAVKFTEAGGVLVSVDIYDTEPGRRLRISVADTGPGLRKKDIDRIFNEFEQGDGTSTRRHGGAGLGLAISRRIVEAMGGSIDVEGEQGEGSEFTILLPVVDAVERPIDFERALSGCRAVIISGNLMEAEGIARTIAAHAGLAEIARTVEEAAAAARAHGQGYNVVLVDASLERVDGRLLKRLHKAGVNPAEAITLIAPTDRGQLAEYRASGYNTFLARPVRGETLLRVLLASPSRPAAPGGQSDTAGRQRSQASRSRSILIAEDNEINALLARSALEKAGHRVEVVRNGKAAVEALTAPRSAHTYDIVLMDLHMPVMDGLDAIAHIRKHEEAKGLPAVPILVLSADSQEKTRHGVIAHGATGFLTKPVDPVTIADAVDSHTRT